MELTTVVLVLAFIVLLFMVSGVKAFRLLFSLLLTIAALIWVVTPLIVAGHDPELVVFLVSIPLVIAIVYLTEGFRELSHISIIGILLSFLITVLLEHIAINAAGLTGLVSTDDSFLGLAGINLRALLVAGIMLGTVGILTEMVVTQVATVLEFADASPTAQLRIIFEKSYNVGIAHLGSIINTLFLVYAGVSFPLLIIYVGTGSSLYSALNYEPLVSDILRTLCGTIGLIIAMPLSTALAVWLSGRKTRRRRLT